MAVEFWYAMPRVTGQTLATFVTNTKESETDANVNVNLNGKFDLDANSKRKGTGKENESSRPTDLCRGDLQLMINQVAELGAFLSRLALSESQSGERMRKLDRKQKGRRVEVRTADELVFGAAVDPEHIFWDAEAQALTLLGLDPMAMPAASLFGSR